MKKLITISVLVVICLLSIVNCYSQPPQGIPYQAVLRDANKNIIANSAVTVQFILHEGSATGTSLYDQTLTGTNNDFGLITTTIGVGGTVNSGNFGTIAWASGPKWLQVFVNTVDMGTNQLYSVPYALNSNGSSGGSVPNPLSSAVGNTMHWDGLAWIADNTIYNNGTKVGIGTTTPDMKLTLDNDGGIMANGTLGSGAILPNTGNGVRMFWYPRKAAFRAGGTVASEWDDANIGNYSFASGNANKASGSNSFAGGLASEATGAISIAFGDHATANGYGSVALGVYANASGQRTVAIGNGVSTNNYYGAMTVGDGNSLSFTTAASDNSFTSRFDGGYRLFSDGTNTIANCLFFTGGKMGIGVASPSSKLDVNGTVRIMGGNPQTNYVLTALNSSGDAVWLAPPSGIASGTAVGNTPYWDGTQWNHNSSNIYNNGTNVGVGTTAGAKVGIATSTPQATLDVNGSMRLKVRHIAYTTGFGDLTINPNDNTIVYDLSFVSGTTNTITGIVSPFSEGSIITIFNSAADNQNIVLFGQSLSTSGIKFQFGVDLFLSPINYTLSPNHSVTLILLWDAGPGSLAWKILSTN